MNQVFDERAALDSIASSLLHGDPEGELHAQKGTRWQEGQLDGLISRLLELESKLAATANGKSLLHASSADMDADSMQSLLKSVASLQIERDQARMSLEQRFDEIVVLTRMLEEARSRVADASKVAASLKAANIRIAEGVKLTASLKKQLVAAKVKGDRARQAEERVRRSQLIQVELVKHLQNAYCETPFDKLRQSWRNLHASLASGKARRRAIHSLGKTFRGGREEFARCAGLLHASVLFDAEWYLERYPDVAQSNVMPDLHYLKFGAAENRDPGPLFSTKRYLDLHPDVAKSRINPLVHYITYGLKERRMIEPSQVK